MTSSVMSSANAEVLIRKACDELLENGFHLSEALDAALDVLLWARWIPISEGKLIGYFDAMRSLTNEEDWAEIQTVIDERSGRVSPTSFRMHRLTPKSLEHLRATLLPVGRALNSSNSVQSKAIIEAMSEMKAGNRSGGELGCSSSMGSFWDALLATHSNEAVACLFPMGVAAAPFIAMRHPLLFSATNPSQASWVLGLLSLYPQEMSLRPITDLDQWPVAIAAPPWGERTRQLLIDDPLLPGAQLDCPSAIKDNEARRVFAAHQRCTGTTYALMSPGVAFRTSKDLEYFREELVRKNWLEAVIALPPGSHAGTSLEGLLLILKRDRPVGAPVQMIAAQELLAPREGKSSKQVWDISGVQELAQLLNHRTDSPYARLINAEELETNGFSFQVSRYLHSEHDLLLQRYLDSRTTMQLGDLAEIRRPVASLSRQQQDGIEVREVTQADIDDSGQLRQGSKRILLPEAALSKGRQQLLEQGDVLLSIKGGLGKVAVVQELEHPTIPGQAFCVVRLRPNALISSAALAQYLRSAVGQSLLNKVSQGSPVAFVPMGEVKSLPIVIPTADELTYAEQMRKQSAMLNREVFEITQKLADLSRRGWLGDLPSVLISSDEEVSA